MELTDFIRAWWNPPQDENEEGYRDKEQKENARKEFRSSIDQSHNGLLLVLKEIRYYESLGDNIYPIEADTLKYLKESLIRRMDFFERWKKEYKEAYGVDWSE